MNITREEVQTLIDILLSYKAQEFRKGADAIERLQSKLAEKDDVETEFIKAWNADKVVRVSDGKRPSEFEKEPKPWVGLTDDEWQALYVHHHDTSGHTDSQWGYEFTIQAKLKEKNT